MAVAIPIGAKADDDSFKNVANQVVKIFDDLGVKVGRDFSESLSDGLSSSESAVRSSASKMVSSYDKVADSIGKTKTIQEQLNAAQESGNTVRIVRETERLEAARRKESAAIRQTINDLKNYENAARDAHSAFGQGFSSGFSRSRVGGYFADLKSEAQSSGSMAGVLAGRAMGAGITAGLAAATAGVAAVVGGVGYALTKGFARYEAIDAAKHRLDNLNKTLAATGKAEIDVKGAMDVVNDVVQGTPFSLDAAFSLSTRALSSNTGDLRRFMTDVADAAGFSGDSIDNIGEAFLKVANTGKVSMDLMSNELRNLPVLPWLQQQLGVSGAELEKMISKGKVGLEDLLRAVEKNAPGFAKAAGDTLQGSIENMQTAVARAGAKFLGALFGQPTDDANTLKDAVTVLTGKIDQLGKWVDAHQGDIKRLFDDGATAARRIGDVLGFVVDHLGMVAVGAGTAAAAFIAWKTITGVAVLIESLEKVNTLLSVSLPASAVSGAARISAALVGPAAELAAVIASLDYIQSHLPESMQGREPTIDKDLGPNQGAGLSGRSWTHDATHPWEIPQRIWRNFFGSDAPADSAPAPNFYKDWYPTTPLPAPTTAPAGSGPAGSPILAPPGLSDDAAAGGGGGGGKGKEADPFIDPALWSLKTNPLPGVSDYATDDTSILSARERLEEARLRALVLEAKGNASQQETLIARNNVLQAERGLRDAELNATKKHEDALKRQTGAMEQLGAQIDQDFGISKGLPGIAENLTKFVANLALAPALGAMQAVVSASGVGQQGAGSAVGGYGYPGGFFGGMSGGFGGNVGAMMALAQSASGRTAYAPASDLVNGLADCSGSISDLVETLRDGRPNPGRLFDTTAFASDESAARLGFRRGSMPGALNIGVNPYPGNSGHMAATLPNGVNFEGGGGTGGGAQYGGNAAGAFDPQFEKQFYMPVGPPSMPYGVLGGGGYGYMPPAASVIGGDGAYLPGLVPGAGQGLATAAIGAGPGGVPMPAPVGIAAPIGSPSGTAPAGIAPSAGAGGEGFQGVGGMPLDAMMTAASALDVLAPGAGMAAQKGIQLVNRAIGFGGQLAGIGVSGLMSTFLPHESPLADMGNSWFGRIASGFAGARPAGKNMAGQSTLPNEQDARKKPGQGEPTPGGNTMNSNITINNNGATEDGNGRDAAYHQQVQYANMPGKR